MTVLDFTTEFKSSQLQQLDIPVEVRSANLALAGRTTSSQNLTVEPGAYYVTALLPSGHELSGFVKAQGESTTVELALEPGEELPAEAMESLHFLTSQAASVPLKQENKLERLGAAAERQVSLRWINGNLFSSELEVRDSDPFTPNEREPLPLSREQEGPMLVQLHQPGFAPLTIAAPIWLGQQTMLAFARQPDGHWTFDVQLANSGANLLLHYRARGYAKQAAQSLTSPQFAEALFQGKLDDPIAAAVGAYALLRFAELERLHDWTENLYDWFPLFPDGAAILGEHLARKGEHEQALEAFVALAERGLPLFTDGFSFALDRLRLYLETETMRLRPLERQKAEGVVELLKQLAPLVDVGQPILTMSGDPLETAASAGPGTPRPTIEPQWVEAGA
jgi:hypothetical protein